MSSATTPAGKPPPTTRHGAEETLLSIAISTSVGIDAPKQLVWDVLTDFSAYREWNPYMGIEGTLRVGTKLTGRMGTDRGRGTVFKPAVLAAIPTRKGTKPDTRASTRFSNSAGEELRWLGKLGLGVGQVGRTVGVAREEEEVLAVDNQASVTQDENRLCAPRKPRCARNSRTAAASETSS